MFKNLETLCLHGNLFAAGHATFPKLGNVLLSTNSLSVYNNEILKSDKRSHPRLNILYFKLIISSHETTNSMDLYSSVSETTSSSQSCVYVLVCGKQITMLIFGKPFQQQAYTHACMNPDALEQQRQKGTGIINK